VQPHAVPTSDRVIEVLLLAQERDGSIVRTILEDLVLVALAIFRFSYLCASRVGPLVARV
jgi:hypothetical protein